jgi:hypothetical protein
MRRWSVEREKLVKLILLPVGVLVILAWVAYSGVSILRNAADNAVQPVSDLAGDLGTQVAQVLYPTPTILPDPVTVVREVSSLARLETIQYSVEKVVTADAGQEFLKVLFGDRLLLVAHGMVIAGVDLAKFSADDIYIENGLLFIRLPDAEIFVATLDNDQSYIYDRQIGFLRRGDVDLETAARRVAEDEIEKGAIVDGILEQAQENAESFLERMFFQMGFPEVVFIDYD